MTAFRSDYISFTFMSLSYTPYFSRIKMYYNLSCFLLNDQRDALFFMHSFIFLTLYMFRAHRAHHQERQIVSIQPLVAVTLRRWPCRVLVGSWEYNIRIDCLVCRSTCSQLPTCTRHGHRRRVTATRGCIDTICLSWWWARCARNM